MKTAIIKISLCLVLIAGVTSCRLDQYPKTSIATDEAFKTYDDAANFANGLNTFFRANQYGKYDYTFELQSDKFNAMMDYGNRSGGPHTMGPSFNSGDYDIRDVWRGCYQTIAKINEFLEKIAFLNESIKFTEAQQKSVNVMIGNAHFYRAASYHKLLRVYSGVYDPATAATALGVPLELKPDLNGKPARATVAAVYAQIDSDIAIAKTNLASVAGVAMSEVPTIDAVKALEARVRFYTKKYSEAANIAGELISSGKYVFSTTLVEMVNEWTNDTGKESIFQMFSALNELANSNSPAYLSWNVANKYYVPDYIPSKKCLDMYEANDIRYQAWFLPDANCFINSGNCILTLFNKYPGNPKIEVAPNRNYVNKPKVFTLGELYMIRVESLAMLGDPAAKDVLNALQSARETTLTDASMANIKKEWARETIGQGFAVDCMKRWNEGYTGRPAQSGAANVVNTGALFTDKVCPAGYYFFTWAIPNVDMVVNENLVQNPGWGVTQ